MATTKKTIRIKKLQDQGSERDLLNYTPAERIGMMWQLTLDAWAFMGDKSAKSGLSRHIVHIYRRKI